MPGYPDSKYKKIYLAVCENIWIWENFVKQLNDSFDYKSKINKLCLRKKMKSK